MIEFNDKPDGLTSSKGATPDEQPSPATLQTNSTSSVKKATPYKKSDHVRQKENDTPSQDMIELPALAPPKIKSDITKSIAGQQDKLSAKKSTLIHREHDQSKAGSSTSRNASGDGDAFLPDYHAETNGLRELLSAIDPLDNAYYRQTTPLESTASEHAPFEQSPVETPMYIPHSRPGIPGSPDLPVAPTRWALYFSAFAGVLFFLVASALTFSHLSSPTGIDWTKLQQKSLAGYEWVISGFADQKDGKSAKTAQIADKNADKIVASSPTHPRFDKNTDGTVTATTPRISTTAGSQSAGGIKNFDDSNSPASRRKADKQISAIESKNQAGKRLRTKPGISEKTRASADDYPIARQASNIDPEMESQIFKRARTYLKQRDISSARMILQYAAGLGSGISAMALAETFDPNFLKQINLQGVSGDQREARKWYKMAASLGIKEAKERLSHLK